MWRRLFPVLLLAGCGLLFFHDLVRHPAQVLYADHSDLLPLHLPSKVFLVRSWQETGELPLWSPHSFSGLPFLHDTQVSAFYPFHVPLLWLPPEHVGAALGWLVLLHVIAAGGCMYLYARGQGLERTPALVAGLGYMFAGKWLIHVLAAGHYNMIPLAWLPLVLYWLEQALRQGSLVRATWAGAAFSLFILAAYPYITLYAGLFVAFWSLGTALEQAGYLDGKEALSPRRTAQALARWAGYGAWMAAVGVAMGAVQLLPALESAAAATRSLGVAASNDMLLASIHALCMLCGRSFLGDNLWELEGGFGFLWVVAAVLAPLLRRGQVRYRAAVAVVLLVYALGGAVLLQSLPGFRLFRLPTRMLLLVAFPVAYLAGVTTQALFADPAPLVRLCRPVLLRVAAVILILQGGFTAMHLLVRHTDSAVTGAALSEATSTHVHLAAYWFVLPFTAAGAYWLFARLEGRHRPGLVWCWVGLLLADLWAVTGKLVEVRPAEALFTPAACVQDLARRVRETGGRVLDREPDQSTSTPLWPALPELLGLESAAGFNPTDVRRYKEYLQFITDSDEPLRPPTGPFTSPMLSNFPIKNKPLLDLLGVRYLLQPAALSLKDVGEKPVATDPRWQAVGHDPGPVAFDFNTGGMQAMPPYVLYENREVLPRAFVVPEAAALPEGHAVLPTLKATDFRRRVLLERVENKKPVPLTAADLGGSSPSATPERPVAVREYRPNRVAVAVPPGSPGYLVLTDIWFPGWTCQVDGQPAEIYRANYLFRAVRLPATAREVIFTFAPVSYAHGRIVSSAGLLLLLVVSLAGLWRRKVIRQTVADDRAAGAAGPAASALAPVHSDPC